MGNIHYSTRRIGKCPYCGSEPYITSSIRIYGRGTHNLWVCTNYPECNSLVACHGTSNIPMGTMANPELRRLRMITHNAFDPLWRVDSSKRYFSTRDRAYKWLAQRLGIEDEEDGHIGMFDKDTCNRAIHVCNEFARTRTVINFFRGCCPVEVGRRKNVHKKVRKKFADHPKGRKARIPQGNNRKARTHLPDL